MLGIEGSVSAVGRWDYERWEKYLYTAIERPRGEEESVNICQYNNAQIERISNVHTWFEWKMVTVVSWLCHYLLVAAVSESIVNGNGQIKWRMNNETQMKKNNKINIYTQRHSDTERIGRQRTNINKNIKWCSMLALLSNCLSIVCIFSMIPLTLHSQLVMKIHICEFCYVSKMRRTSQSSAAWVLY